MTEVISKERIGREALRAWERGEQLNAACPYPWHTDAARHFRAVYYCAPIFDAWRRVAPPFDERGETGAP